MLSIGVGRPQLMNTRCIRAYVASLLLIILSGCASKEPIKVKVELGATSPGAVYRTYAWRSEPVEGNPLSPTDATRRDWRIRATVDGLLAGKGYTRSAQAPDFLVDYDLNQKQMNTESFESYYDYYRAGGAKSPSEAFTVGYLEGSLVLGFFDASSQTLIWRASASVLVDQANADAQITEALERMLARWPARNDAGPGP